MLQCLVMLDLAFSISIWSFLCYSWLFPVAPYCSGSPTLKWVTQCGKNYNVFLRCREDFKKKISEDDGMVFQGYAHKRNFLWFILEVVFWKRDISVDSVCQTA